MQKETLLSFQTPTPKKIPSSLCAYGRTWVDPYRWMSNTGDPNLVDHLHNENSYAEAFMADTQTLRRRLVAEMKARMPAKIVTPPESWGDWGGGGDSSWHHAGSGLHKLNSMHDFAACGSYLISEATSAGFWASAKWVARVREITCPSCSRPVILKTPMSGEHFGEGGRFQHCEETAFEYAFLIKAIGRLDGEMSLK